MTLATGAAPLKVERPAVGSPMTVTSLPELLEAAGRLTAVTQEVDPASVPDLVRAGGRPGRHLWGRGGQVILGIGEALRVPLPAGWAAPAHTSSVGDALAAIRTEGDSGSAGKWTGCDRGTSLRPGESGPPRHPPPGGSTPSWRSLGHPGPPFPVSELDPQLGVFP